MEQLCSSLQGIVQSKLLLDCTKTFLGVKCEVLKTETSIATLTWTRSCRRRRRCRCPPESATKKVEAKALLMPPRGDEKLWHESAAAWLDLSKLIWPQLRIYQLVAATAIATVRDVRHFQHSNLFKLFATI